jgi:hypothetical protein
MTLNTLMSIHNMMIAHMIFVVGKKWQQRRWRIIETRVAKDQTGEQDEGQVIDVVHENGLKAPTIGRRAAEAMQHACRLRKEWMVKQQPQRETGQHELEEEKAIALHGDAGSEENQYSYMARTDATQMTQPEENQATRREDKGKNGGGKHFPDRSGKLGCSTESAR